MYCQFLNDTQSLQHYLCQKFVKRFQLKLFLKTYFSLIINIIFNFLKSLRPMYYFILPSMFNIAACNWTLSNVPASSLITSSNQSEAITPTKSVFSPTIIHSQASLTENSQETTLSGHRNIKTKTKQKIIQKKDDQYKPDSPSAKKNKKIQQLQNRNVVPNIIRLILSFIQKKGKSSTFVEKLFNQTEHPTEWNSKRFYLFQAQVRAKMNNYVNEETLTQLSKTYPQDFGVYPEQQQRFYNKITRIIIHHFLREEVSMSIITSKRMDSSKKREHLRSHRYIAGKLNQLLGA